MDRCEDYPCCGHTDGLGCNWKPPVIRNPEDAFEPGSPEYWEARWEREETEDEVAREIHDEQAARLEALQFDMGYDSGDWQDSY